MDRPVSSAMTGDLAVPAQLWGTGIEPGRYAGHDGLVYRPRPRQITDMLTGTERWNDRTFIVYADRRTTFAGFRAAMAGTAAMLRERGIAAGDRVMLRAYNCPEFA